ncbi:hypothetical protein [Methanonatronarchaeum sp. AMET-Sl]|nr:hypothetical protein [Methanonatronarchaeum sp. AMET-Sl]WGI17023.1 hypothetical protein QEN48_05855 [Methanonatronarchaeum sp. AMET-Sl]
MNDKERRRKENRNNLLPIKKVKGQVVDCQKWSMNSTKKEP